MSTNRPMRISRDTRRQLPAAPPVMSKSELARLGCDQVAYIREMTPYKARQLFPKVTGIPDVASIYVVYAADGENLLMTDNWQDCHIQAFEHDLEIVTTH